MSEIKLFIHSSPEGISFPEALAAFEKVGGEAIGLLYSPRSCVFAVLAEGVLQGSDGQPIDLSAVYEARVFCKKAELRWLNDPTHERRHRAVMLSEQDRSVGEGWQHSDLSVIDTLPQTYLLWGEGTEAKTPLADGWSLLATPRIGGLQVPVGEARSNRQRVLLHTVEYLIEGEYGNVVVADERLCRLEVING
ncbi:MAG: CRISPR-associated protein Csx19 [Gemmataceae bacterium]